MEQNDLGTAKSHKRQVIVFIALCLVSVVLVAYVTLFGRSSRAALGPNAVAVTIEQSADQSGLGAGQKRVSITLNPVDNAALITGFDLTFSLSNNATFVSSTAPVGFGDEIIKSLNGSGARLVYVVKGQDPGQSTAFITMVVASTGATSTMTLDTSKSEVVGTLSQIAFDFDTNPVSGGISFDGSVVPTNPPGTNPTLPPTNPTTPPSNSGNITINLKLRFQGIPSQPRQATPEIVRVSIKKESIITSQNVTVVPVDGFYEGSANFDVPVGSGYSLLVKGPRHLQKRVCDATPTETALGTYRCPNGNITLNAGANPIDMSGIGLLVGDVPTQDGVIDAYDLTYIRQSIGSSATDRTLVGDLNRDGIVDTQDYSLVIQSLNIKYDEL